MRQKHFEDEAGQVEVGRGPARFADSQDGVGGQAVVVGQPRRVRKRDEARIGAAAAHDDGAEAGAHEAGRGEHRRKHGQRTARRAAEVADLHR